MVQIESITTTLNTMSKTLYALSGSLRENSYNTSLLKAFIEHAPEGVTIELLDTHDVPLYNQDHEANMPEAVSSLKEKICSADGIIIATPEYNRSVPGMLKNVIDWTSRPYGQNSWKGIPVYVVGASTGPIAAALAQYELKKIMLYLDARVLGQSEFYLGNATEKISADGVLTDASTIDHVRSSLETFLAFIDR